MYYRDPNRPVRTPPLREEKRDLDTKGTGNFGKDGYRLLGRRPRVRHVTEPMSPERADRIEGFMLDIPDMDAY